MSVVTWISPETPDNLTISTAYGEGKITTFFNPLAARMYLYNKYVTNFDTPEAHFA
jgi:hypothetical protein